MAKSSSSKNPSVSGNNGVPGTGGEEFTRMAEEKPQGFLMEFWSFIRQNKKWWLTPIFVILLLLILLVVISQTPLAPFIYPFF